MRTPSAETSRLRFAKLSLPQWFGLSPEGRLNVLAIIKFLQGDKCGVLKILDEALLERKGALPAKRLPIEAVRGRLVAAN